ncbi:hypothetical protein [Mesorhizobium sp. B2-4-17]|uniref:hypothetical protein n=1 Tax=Mesorhizobium sp. B2-4-17 TaxID=2589932 RepID=UPI00112A6086|nr:hypothetical protein [Mesorhizobium sp. B2-4-17]TPK78222.1 hypothetical protein FJ548_25145 [Mesorhizobium sp. B2-4-17]
MDPKARFNLLRGDLALPLDELARLLRRPYGTVKAWASDSRLDLIPPADVLAAMEAEMVGRAIARIRAAGFDVIPRRKAA